MKSFDQVARVLNLIPYLQAHPGSRMADVAAHLQVSEAELLRDLKVAWMCGLPGGLPGDLIEVDMELVESEGVINLTNAEYLSRPMRFTADEVFSLRVAVSVLAELATGDQRQVVASTLAKLEQLAGENAAAPVAVGITGGPEAVRDQLQQAIEARRRVRLTYDGLNRGQTTRPEVDPAAIVLRDGVAYLRGWSLARSDWRTFRLDRVAEVEVLDEAADDHKELPPMATGWFDDVVGASDVTLELAPEAAWVVEYDPTESVRRTDDGTVVASFRVVDPQWVTRQLLTLAEGVRRTEPPEAAAMARELATEALALQQGVAGL
ncbi:helix-turn-helix transcriptional regulator [Aestuariimicrobium ganziense]|uniref:helix-turn-helix transcriptional regulator n=1 Tax=Aestuariimicrobium ganziense TaxID=2773677 RepID=UPI00194387F7|nr:WYL domain-containing protein [Aestuariimicrobium ganziense]